jgi:site-specific DNA recombinase
MTVRRNQKGLPVYRCRAKGHCSWPAERVDQYIENVIVARLSRPDVTDLIPGHGEVDVAGLRDELIVCDARKRSAAHLFATATIDEAQLATITAELDQQMAGIRAELTGATGATRWPTSP